MLRTPAFLLPLACLFLLAGCSGSDTKSDASPPPDELPEGKLDAGRADGGRPSSDAGADGKAPSSLDARTQSDMDAQPEAEPEAGSMDEGEDGGAEDTADADEPAPGDDGGAFTESDAAPIVADGSDAQVDAGPVSTACDPSAAPQPAKLGLRTVISDATLSGLTEATQPPNSDDWYLVEQRGRIMVLQDGVLRSEPFLDLTSEISLRPIIYEDRGLVSIAFAPDYETSGLVYVSVTPNLGAEANVDLLIEYRRSSANPYQLDPASRRNIIAVSGSRLWSSTITDNIHNGGRVTFGPDGMLYLALGDGGSINCGDVEPDAPQRIDSLFGKLLRLDLSKPAPYAPDDNPFVQNGNPLVLHYGLRNPFRFSFDRLNGDLYLGDVGQNRYEEIDHAPLSARGLNFGWAPYEGLSRDTCPTYDLREGSTHTPPIFVADRRAGATSPFSDYTAMIGGVVYRGTAIPSLSGAYLFGPYSGRRLGALYQCGAATSPVTPIAKSCDPNNPLEACLSSLDGAPVFRELRAIVEDHAGEVYVVANGNSLLKVVPHP